MTKGEKYHELIVDDAAYLMDELKALKRIISAIPYDEKPVEQESIQEMIEIIGHKQINDFYPAIKDAIINSTGDIDSGSQHVMKDYSGEFGVENNAMEEQQIEIVIDDIIHARSDIITLLNQCSEDDFSRPVMTKGREKTLKELVIEMVRFDRNQFRKVAERVSSLEVDRNSGPDIHR